MKTIAKISVRLFITVGLTFSAFASRAQSPVFTIKGFVVDSVLQKNLDLVTITLNQGSKNLGKVMTNEEGAFSLAKISAGKYQLFLTSVGYEPKRVLVDLTKHSKVIFDLGKIMLSNTNAALKAVTVTANRPFIEHKDDRLVINVSQSINSAGSTVLEALEKVPGVTIDQDGKILMAGKEDVRILLDGKPTYLGAAEISKLLKGMSANQIEQIELITNPSSKYDAAGNAGVINIKSKKNKPSLLGFNTSVTAGYGKHAKLSTTNSFSVNSGKWNIHSAFNHSFNKGYWVNNSIRATVVGGLYLQERDAIWLSNQSSFKLAADYALSDKSSIGISGSLNRNRSNSELDMHYNTKVTEDSPFYIETGLIHYKNRMDNQSISLSYNKKIREGQEFDIVGDYVENNYDYTGNNVNQAESSVMQRSHVHSSEENRVRIGAVKADYSHPLGKGWSMEIGAKSATVAYAVQNQNESGEGEVSAVKSFFNQYHYRELINAAYVKLNGNWKKFTFNAGLRFEHIFWKAIALDYISFKRAYVNLFPSLFLKYDLSSKNSLSLSYTRRINRPFYLNLNPSVYPFDSHSSWQGNPHLRPELSNSSELIFRNIPNNFMMSLSYQTSNDVIAMLHTNSGDGNLYVSPQNSNSNTVAGLLFNKQVKLDNKWQINTNLRLNYSAFKNRFNNGFLHLRHFNWGANTTLYYPLLKQLKGELSFNTSSWNISFYSLSKYKGQTYFDGGLSYSLFKDKASLKLSMTDIFGTRKFEMLTQTPDINYKLKGRFESQVARLTFTWQIGKKLKATSEKKAGLEEESRIGGGQGEK